MFERWSTGLRGVIDKMELKYLYILNGMKCGRYNQCRFVLNEFHQTTCGKRNSLINVTRFRPRISMCTYCGMEYAIGTYQVSIFILLWMNWSSFYLIDSNIRSYCILYVYIYYELMGRPWPTCMTKNDESTYAACTHTRVAVFGILIIKQKIQVMRCECVELIEM